MHDLLCVEVAVPIGTSLSKAQIKQTSEFSPRVAMERNSGCAYFRFCTLTFDCEPRGMTNFDGHRLREPEVSRLHLPVGVTFEREIYYPKAKLWTMETAEAAAHELGGTVVDWMERNEVEEVIRTCNRELHPNTPDSAILEPVAA